MNPTKQTFALGFIIGTMALASCQLQNSQEQIVPVSHSNARPAAVGPDLVITSFSQNNPATQNATHYFIPLKIYEKNQGTDNVCVPGGDSVFIFQRLTSGIVPIRFVGTVLAANCLAPGQTHIATSTIMVPKNYFTSATNRQFFAIADYKNKVAELSETNNTSKTITVTLP